MKSIEEILLELVSIQSDTGTEMECDIAKVIYDMIAEERYFKNHREHFGAFEDGDVFKRPVIWALKKGNSKKTIILMGHYDAVEIETYGTLKEYALNPVLLKSKFKEIDYIGNEIKEDLNSEDWAFGRGIADMKSGVAINLHVLLTNENEDINILFIAVPDEENMSSGAIQSIKLYHMLKEKFNLDYKLCIISEPQFRSVEENEEYHIYEGSTGKILPIIMAKGILSHAAEIYNGLNSGFIISEIIRNIELTTDMISEDRGVFTQPPTVQIFKDLKKTYDVSLPEYSVACFNILFLKNKSPLSIINDLLNISKKSLDYVVCRYNESFDIMKEKGFIKEEKRKIFNTQVFTLDQLEEYVKVNNPNFSEIKRNLELEIDKNIKNKNMTLQDASIHYMKVMLESATINQPVVVVGVAPPYYPAVCNFFLDKDIRYIMDGLSEYMKSLYGIGTKSIAYLSGMCDMSYMNSSDPLEERKLLDNLVLPSSIYNIPIEDIANLNIPTLMIGPACKDVHQLGERVYMPDVKERIPMIFNKIINNL